MGKVVLMLMGISAGLGLLSLHLVKQLREGDATIAELKAQVTSLQEQAAATPTSTPPPPAIAAGSEPPHDVAPAPSKDAPKTAPSRAVGAIASIVPTPPSREDAMRMMREHRERQRQLMQDPEYREAMRMQSRSTLARQYPGVIQELGLDRQQAEEFFGMLADQQLRSSERMEPLWDVSGAENRDPAAIQEQHRKIQQAAGEMQRNNEAELAARFGQDKLQAWKEYQSTVGMRYQLDHMRNTLSANGLPLNEDVSRPMLKALAQAQKAEADEYAAAASRGAAPTLARSAANIAFEGFNTEQQIENTRKRNQRMLDAVSSYLTYEQRQALEKEQEAQLKMMEAQLRVMRARGQTNSNGVFYTDSSAHFIAVPQ